MVIQANMPVSSIVCIWAETVMIFEKYRISTNVTLTLDEVASGDTLSQLLRDLNQAIGSSDATCIEGG